MILDDPWCSGTCTRQALKAAVHLRAPQACSSPQFPNASTTIPCRPRALALFFHSAHGVIACCRARGERIAGRIAKLKREVR